MRKRVALGVSIPVVVVFIGILIALLLPSNLLTLTEALDRLGLLGSRERIPGLIGTPPGDDAPPDLLVRNGLLWDAAGGLRPNPGLYLVAGRISGAAPSGHPRIIDATGMTILPGLIDMHVHSFGGTFGDEMMIGSGITTARDLGTQLAGALRHRQESASGVRIGPRLFVTGPYLVSGAATGDQEIGVSSPETAAALVRRFADAGVDGIKVHSGIDEATLRAVVAEAHKRGLWVAAHLDRVDAVQASGIGVDTIEHASGIDLEEGHAADARREAAIGAMVAGHVALTPTLVVAEHAFTIAELGRPDNPALRFVPRFMRRFWIASQLANARAEELTPLETEKRRGRLGRLERFVLRFHQAGGRVLAGTDTPAFLVAPGIDMHREIELLVEAGLTPAEALASATSEAAAAMGRAGELGGLAPGCRADLLIVEGNPFSGAPRADITRDIRLVVKDGRILLRRPSSAEVGAN
ncbi:MAG TPA: amidohydrolase family protein [Patescibacteria group bacterium]|nr:amidohydrolase family protein [Patescibacteria group bacterium]